MGDRGKALAGLGGLHGPLRPGEKARQLGPGKGGLGMLLRRRLVQIDRAQRIADAPFRHLGRAAVSLRPRVSFGNRLGDVH